MNSRDDDEVIRASGRDEDLRSLLRTVRELIQRGREQAVRAVDAIQVQTCWQIGRHIVEFEQAGADRAEYGKGLMRQLAEALTGEFGKGFDRSNLWHMRAFFLAFPKIDALRRELSWTHYRTLLRVENESGTRLLADRLE